MTLRYTVLGAGAMGLRFGVLLQENAIRQKSIRASQTFLSFLPSR